MAVEFYRMPLAIILVLELEWFTDGYIAVFLLYCYGSKQMNGACMERNQQV